MKPLRYLSMLLLCSCASAQTVTITLQVTDAGAQTWNNGTWAAQLVSPSGTTTFKIAGTSTTVPNQQQSGSLNGTGGATVVVTPNSSIAPANTLWQLIVCPNATSPCFQQSFSLNTTQTLTVVPPAININMASPQPLFTAYADGELSGQVQGSQYFNVTSLVSKIWNGSSWVVLNAGTLGLGDPGSNGVLKRTALNTTAVAASADLIALWTGTCNTTTFLRGDGSCQTISGSVTPIAKSSLSGSGDTGISGAIASLTGGNGIVWADYSTNQTWSACPTWGTGNVQLVLYPVTFTVSVGCTIPSNVTLRFEQGAKLSPANTTTTTIQGNIQASQQQIFTNIASGQGALSFTSNRTLTTMYATWFGIDCTGVADTAVVWNQILTFVGEDVTMVVPNNCSQNVASTITVSSRAGFKIKSEDRVQNGGGNQKPAFVWSGSTGGMWNFVANQAPTVEGFAFSNGSSAHMDYILQFDGAPAARIGTEAMVRYNTFTNNMTNPTVGGLGTYDAIKINTVSGQNHEKNVITDNDFFCSQSKTFTESSSTQITNGSQNVTCGAGNCTYTTDANPGDRVRISYATASVGTAPGIQDTTIQSITDNNHLVLTAASTATTTNARIQFRQAYGNGITIGSVNSKHNTIDRNSFTQCSRGVNMTNGSFSLEHVGGSANDTLIYINNTAEPTQLNYVEDESTLRDVFINNIDGQVTMNHLRNSLGIAGEYDGFIYVAVGGRIIIEGSVLQDTPGTNQIVINAVSPSTVQLTAFGNTWAPGTVNMAQLGYAAWRTFAEGAATGLGNGELFSCNDYGISDSPGGCFQFGDGGTASSTQEGHSVVSSSRFGNFSSFNVYTAQPNVQVNTFLNEAIGYKSNMLGFNMSSSMKFVGFDAGWKLQIGSNGIGNGIGFRYTMPTNTGTAQPFEYGLQVVAPAANSNITLANGVRVEDLAAHTGIATRYSFFGVGATDTAHFGGPVEAPVGPITSPAFNTPSGPVSGTWNCVNVTPVTVSTSTTNDQNLMACTVPAGTLNSVGRTLRIHAKSLYTTPAASVATLTFKAKLCSVSGCGSGNIATLVNITSSANPGSVTNNTAILDLESTTQTGGAASRSEASGDLLIDLGAVATSPDTIFADTNATTIAGSPSDIDFTAQNFLQITVAFSVASGSNSVTERQLVVDSVN